MVLALLVNSFQAGAAQILFQGSPIESTTAIHATLRSAYLDGFDWTPDHLLNFVGDFFDHERVFNSDADVPNTDVRDKLVVKYNPDRIIREQLSTPMRHHHRPTRGKPCQR
uniref:Uncharacterized protein n=1 Tax=Candidatus Nitrotoga fabula TaxID=2182327 RepID=A0A2X0QWV9_9PROT|nr:exported protein of unknown function [Candidatus Nitrotoga fabula]